MSDFILTKVLRNFYLMRRGTGERRETNVYLLRHARIPWTQNTMMQFTKIPSLNVNTFSVRLKMIQLSRLLLAVQIVISSYWIYRRVQKIIFPRYIRKDDLQCT